jgi:hypothetical protein
VGLSVYPSIVAGQRCDKHVPATTNMGGVVFCSVLDESKENRRLVLHIISSCIRRFPPFYAAVSK